MLMPCWKLIFNELLCFSNVADSECQVYSFPETNLNNGKQGRGLVEALLHQVGRLQRRHRNRPRRTLAAEIELGHQEIGGRPALGLAAVDAVGHLLQLLDVLLQLHDQRRLALRQRRLLAQLESDSVQIWDEPVALKPQVRVVGLMEKARVLVNLPSRNGRHQHMPNFNT